MVPDRENREDRDPMLGMSMVYWRSRNVGMTRIYSDHMVFMG